MLVPVSIKSDEPTTGNYLIELEKGTNEMMKDAKRLEVWRKLSSLTAIATLLSLKMLD